MVVGGFVIDMSREAERRAETAVVTRMHAPYPPLLPITEKRTELDEDVGEQLARDEGEGEP